MPKAAAPKAPKDKKEKKVKDPNAPKGPLGSFMLYAADVRPQIKRDCPDLKATEVAKKMGEMWRDAADSTKTKYKDLADKDKERYQKEMAEYES